MYFHVLIETQKEIGAAKSKQFIEMDRTDKKALLSDIIVPLINGESFQIDGYLIGSEDVVRYMVKTSKSSAKSISRNLTNENFSSGIANYISTTDIFFFDDYTEDITKEILYEAKQSNKVKRKSICLNNEKDIDKKKVFIVHGHQETIKSKVAYFVEKLGLDAIILSEQTNTGNTIIEKIERNSDVGFAIIIYTGCDFGGEDSSNLKKRARQNVVFEHGYFCGKLGRDKVSVLTEKDVELLGDVNGLVYIELDNDGGWKLKLARELKKAGLPVDLNLIEA